MGTTAHVIVAGGPSQLVDHAVQRLVELERRWSRFLPDSEISQLNARSGVPVVVSHETFQLIQRAIAGWRMTRGRFDPTLLRELRAAGYDRSFDEIRAHPIAPVRPVAAPRSPRKGRGGRVGADAITIDPIVESVQLEDGVEFDPGGIGKGFAADLIVEELLKRGALGALVNVGGDLRAEGSAPDGGSWIVGVSDPIAPDHTVLTLAIASGGIASSWRTKRTWTNADGETRHHLLDPETGVSAETGLAGVTVVAGRGWHAEVLAKAAFLSRPDRVERLLRDNRAAGVLIADDGSQQRVGDLGPFVVSTPQAEGATT